MRFSIGVQEIYGLYHALPTRITEPSVRTMQICAAKTLWYARTANAGKNFHQRSQNKTRFVLFKMSFLKTYHLSVESRRIQLKAENMFLLVSVHHKSSAWAMYTLYLLPRAAGFSNSATLNGSECSTNLCGSTYTLIALAVVIGLLETYWLTTAGSERAACDNVFTHR